MRWFDSIPAVYRIPFLFIRIALFIELIRRVVALPPKEGNIASVFVGYASAASCRGKPLYVYMLPCANSTFIRVR